METPTLSMRERTCRAACDLLLQDERVAVLLSEISVPFFEEGFRRAPDRIVNVGIMEQTMTGIAAGFAMEGFHPIVHTIAPFQVERPFEQLKVDFGYQELGGTFISIGASYDYSVEGTTHHAPADVALLSTIPGFEVLVPGTAAEAVSLLRAVYANGRPSYLRTSVRQNSSPIDVKPGRIEVIRRSHTGPTVLTVGPMFDPTLQALTGLDATVLYVTTVTPFDSEALNRETREHVIVVEPFLQGTLAPSVMESLAGRSVRLTSIGVPKTNLRGYGTQEDLNRVAGLDVAGIRARILTATGQS